MGLGVDAPGLVESAGAPPLGLFLVRHKVGIPPGSVGKCMPSTHQLFHPCCLKPVVVVVVGRVWESVGECGVGECGRDGRDGRGGRGGREVMFFENENECGCSDAGL